MQTILIRWWNVKATNINKDDLPVTFALNVNNSTVGMAYAGLRSYVDTFDSAKYWVNPKYATTGRQRVQRDTKRTEDKEVFKLLQEGSRNCWWNSKAPIDSAVCDTSVLKFRRNKVLSETVGRFFKTLNEKHMTKEKCADVSHLQLYY